MKIENFKEKLMNGFELYLSELNKDDELIEYENLFELNDWITDFFGYFYVLSETDYQNDK